MACSRLSRYKMVKNQNAKLANVTFKGVLSFSLFLKLLNGMASGRKMRYNSGCRRNHVNLYNDGSSESVKQLQSKIIYRLFSENNRKTLEFFVVFIGLRENTLEKWMIKWYIYSKPLIVKIRTRALK